MARLFRKPRILLLTLFTMSVMTVGCGSRQEKKLILIGFDGLTGSILESMIAEGSLPHFEQMRTGGASGTLASSLPTLAPTAWTSAVTGVNPGKHGIFSSCKGLMPIGENEFQVSYSSAVDRNASPLWTLLSDAGRRSVVLNVPFTSPPDSLNGVMVAGGPFTSLTDYTYPSEIAEKIPAVYTPSPEREELRGKKERDYLDYLNETFETRKTFALDLLDNGEWNAFLVVFTIPDRVQRYFWQYMDETHPLFDAEKAEQYRNAVRDVYVEMDRTLGEFSDRADVLGANLMTFSVFGYEGIRWTINGDNFVSKIWSPEGKDIFLGNSNKYRGLFSIWFAEPPEVNKENWEKYSDLSGVVYEALTTLKNPANGDTVIDTVYHRANIYTGPHVPKAPDIIAIEKSGYTFLNWDRTKDGKLVMPPREGSPAAHPAGGGVFFARGPDITPGSKLDNASIMDLAPTALYLQGTSIPSYMDGHVLDKMITESFLTRHPVDGMIDEKPMDTRKKITALSPEEEELLKQQIEVME